MIASSLAAAAVAGVVLALVVALAQLRPGQDLSLDLAVGVIGAVTVVVGTAIAWRVRDNVVGSLVVLIGVGEAALAARQTYYELIADGIVATPPALLLAVGQNLAVVLFVAIGLLVILFPAGRLPDRRWWWLVGALVIGACAYEAIGIVGSTPFVPPLHEVPPFVAHPFPLELPARVAATILFFGALLAAIVLGLLRVRRATGKVRAQLQWVLLGSCIFLLYPFVCGAEVLLAGRPGLPSIVVTLVGLLALPVGVAIGMLRYDLYDVDRALASAASYGLVLLILSGLFATVAFLVGTLLGGGSALAAAAATAVSALLLAPVHRRMKRFIDARLYPLRRAGVAAIRELGDRVNSGDARPEDLERVLATAVRDPELRIGYLIPGSVGFVDVDGLRVPQVGATSIEVGGETVGVLICPSVSASLRRELAAACAILATVVRLRLQLRESLHEVEASRARIIGAEDEARRRFERDLHDGAQQRLVSLGMSLRIAQRHLGREDVDVDGLLDATVAELTTAIAELRRLAHGIRPSALDEGLAAALGNLARATPIPVELEVQDEELPPIVATAAYYVVAESVANVIKHAEAGSISVRVSRHPGAVRISVRDDGRGGADAEHGSGIVGLRDRVVAVGGSLRLSSPVGSGTIVEAELPCAS